MDFTYLTHFLDEMAEKRTPGNAVLVKLGGREVFRYAAGFSNLEDKKLLTGDEYFYIYSCTKILTITAALKLLEQGKILLSDNLYEYMPEFRHMRVRTPNGNEEDARNPITIRNLFNMTAGFDYDLNAACFQKAGKETEGRFDTVPTVKCLADKPLLFEPGTHWKYSLCHDVLAALVSVITGMKFRDYVKEKILEPLEMENTFFHVTPEILSSMSQQYQFVPESESIQNDLVKAQIAGKTTDGTFVNIGKKNPFIFGTEYDSGGAGITTTLLDYEKLLDALAHYGVGENGSRILSKNTVNLMRTNTLSQGTLVDYNWTRLNGYGYGLGVRTMMEPEAGGSLSSVGEFGWGGAAGAMAFIDPEKELSVFYVQHLRNPREDYYMPRLRNVIYACL